MRPIETDGRRGRRLGEHPRHPPGCHTQTVQLPSGDHSFFRSDLGHSILPFNSLVSHWLNAYHAGTLPLIAIGRLKHYLRDFNLGL